MVEQNCLQCNSKFLTRQADINRGWGKYCSKSCKAKHQEAKTGQYAAYLQGRERPYNPRVPSTNNNKKQSIAVINNAAMIHALNQYLDANFTWKTHTNQFLMPKDMHTRHLCNTLRLIWNLTMPANATIGKVNYSTFGKHYTRDYLIKAIANIYTEILGRDDLTTANINDLKKMADYFNNRLDNTLKLE